MTGDGYCGCGCGERTTISDRTDRKKGRVKGRPMAFVTGHWARVRPRNDAPGPNPGGLCMCGCGKLAPIARQGHTGKGYVKGKPVRFIAGHQGASYRSGSEGPNPGGMCLCGCGEPTPIAKYSFAGRGWVAGEPIQYRKGHHGKAQCAGYAENGHGCWIWQGALDPNGYGKTKHGKLTIMAHRKVWMDERGEIPEGHHLHHWCAEQGWGSKACVNPDHLEPMTPAEHAAHHHLAAAR